MKFFTIGYGGKKPSDFLSILSGAGVKAVIDVRLRPQRANMGVYVKAASAEKGIAGLLSRIDVAYVSMIELGNVFLEDEDWRPRYSRRLQEQGEELTLPLRSVPRPFCLLCCEKRVEECHREPLSDYLLKHWPGSTVEHL